MKIDRYTARALVDANLMSLREYIDKFGSIKEQDAGKTDSMQVARAPSGVNRAVKGRSAGSRNLPPRKMPGLTVTRIHFH